MLKNKSERNKNKNVIKYSPMINQKKRRKIYCTLVQIIKKDYNKNTNKKIRREREEEEEEEVEKEKKE